MQGPQIQQTMARAAVVTALVLTLFCPQGASAQWNVATDFSLASNPAGAWSYGYETTLGSGFTLLSSHPFFCGVEDWGLNPGVWRNPTSAGDITCSTAVLGAGRTFFHPGSAGEYAIYRFTAPVAGTYSLTSDYYGADRVGPTTSDVAVQKNGATLFSANINGFGTMTNYSALITLALGDNLDFAVGYGLNQNYLYDSTGIDAQLDVVPEPATMTLLATGLVGMVGAGMRRRKKA